MISDALSSITWLGRHLLREEGIEVTGIGLEMGLLSRSFVLVLGLQSLNKGSEYGGFKCSPCWWKGLGFVGFTGFNGQMIFLIGHY